MPTPAWLLGFSLMLDVSGCVRPVVVEPSAAATSAARESAPPLAVVALAEQAQVIQNPIVEPMPAPQPPAITPGWHAVVEPSFIQSELLEGTERGARYALDDSQLRYTLDLRVRDDATTLTLTESDSGHTLAHEWPTSMCDYEFYAGDGAGAALAERAHDERGRKLLELWVSCQLGEDIRQTESLMLLVLVDAGGLSLQWSGTTWGHTSHVCGEWSDIETSIAGDELVITQSDRGAIFSPEDLPGYDCDNPREYDTVRDRHRQSLP